MTRDASTHSGTADPPERSYTLYMDPESIEPQEREAQRWAQELMESVRRVLDRHPEADPDNVRHTLILLGEPPIERLRRSLTRGRSSAQ